MNKNLKEKLDVNKTFKETIDAMTKFGISVSNTKSEIFVTVYDCECGENLIHDLKMDSYDAVRVFGDLTVYSVDILENTHNFILNAKPEDT